MSITIKMDILYTVEEKYLQALEELNYREPANALHLFNEIIQADPEYARAYYELGRFYHYQFKNYKTAGYYYKRCIELEAEFPDVYEHYLSLLLTLDMHKTMRQVADKALNVPGVCKACIYEKLGLFAEQHQLFEEAISQYKKAFVASCDSEHSSIQDHLKRVSLKQQSNQKMKYVYQG